jgi:hypothetical protein
MKQASELTEDEGLILAWFAHFLEKDGIDGLANYLTHCGIKIRDGATAGDGILEHYRNPLGYDIDRAAMDLRTWPPISARIRELQNEEAERRAVGKAKRVRNLRAANGHAREHSI